MNWKELQQMAKEFDREVRKERQGAGEHRADAVGLLTPALLRKHIKSGTDLVLAYGRKGATVSYTVDDLKRFVEARERADKAFRPETRGVPLAQLENASREADRQRSQEVKSALLYKVSGNMLFFQVQGNINPHYLVRVRLEDWEKHLHNPYLNPLIAAKEAATGRISFDCACGRHQYWYRYLTQIGGFAINPPKEQDLPKIRNPGLTGCCCKHVLKVLRVLKTNAIQAVLSRELERQSASAGFADPRARLLNQQELKQVSRARGITGQTPESRAALKKFMREAKQVVSTPEARNARKNLKPRRKPGGTQLSTRTAAPMSPDARKMLVKALQAASALLHAIPGATTSAKIIATTSEHYKISQDEVRAIMKEEGIRL